MHRPIHYPPVPHTEHSGLRSTPTTSNAPGKLTDLVRQEPKIVATRFHAHLDRESAAVREKVKGGNLARSLGKKGLPVFAG